MESDKENKIHGLLQYADQDSLRSFLAGYAMKNQLFWDALKDTFDPKVISGSLKSYQDTVGKAFETSDSSSRHHRYGCYVTAEEVADQLNTLLEKADYLRLNGNQTESYWIAKSIIEAIPRNHEYVDDSYGELTQSFEDAIALISDILNAPDISKEQAEEIFHWVKKEIREEYYSNYGFDEINDLFLPATQACCGFEEALIVAQGGVENATGFFSKEKAVTKLINIYRAKGDHLQAEAVIDKHLLLHGIRQMRVDQLMAEKQYKAVIPILKQGIEQEEEDRYFSMGPNCKSQLLKIYILQNDRENILKYARELFLGHGGNFKNYQTLKQYVSKETWGAYLDELLSYRMSLVRIGYVDDVVAQIYINEQYWERLFQLAVSAGLQGIEEYERHLKSHFPDRLLNAYLKEIRDCAERDMGRTHYQYIVGILTKLTAYPNGQPECQKIINEFKIKYKNRRAMMEEIGKII